MNAYASRQGTYSGIPGCGPSLEQGLLHRRWPLVQAVLYVGETIWWGLQREQMTNAVGEDLRSAMEKEEA